MLLLLLIVTIKYLNNMKTIAFLCFLFIFKSFSLGITTTMILLHIKHPTTRRSVYSYNKIIRSTLECKEW